MSWQDVGLYWAWRGPATAPLPAKPYTKQLRYTTLRFADGVLMRIVCVVVDDGVPRRVNVDEINGLARFLGPDAQEDLRLDVVLAMSVRS